MTAIGNRIEFPGSVSTAVAVLPLLLLREEGIAARPGFPPTSHRSFFHAPARLENPRHSGKHSLFFFFARETDNVPPRGYFFHAPTHKHTRRNKRGVRLVPRNERFASCVQQAAGVRGADGSCASAPGKAEASRGIRGRIKKR